MTHIAIIGSGPTAIYTIKHLLALEEKLKITVFEQQAQAGKGTPYHQDWNEKEMLANIASIEIPPVTETLVQWLQGLSEEQLGALGVNSEDITDRAFLPRVALGEYFYAQFTKLVASGAQNGHQIAVHTERKVLDVAMTENGASLTIEALGKVSELACDYVVMATGHAWPTETEVRPGYFLSPWPASSLREIEDCHVGIRGTSLSAIDALVALSVARGSFERDAHGELHYHPEPGTEKFRATIMSRKGILPEADFYHPIPYEPLTICTKEAVKKLFYTPTLLDEVFALFKAELTACDPAYAHKMDLEGASLEEFCSRYFREREEHDPFVWAAMNLAEARANEQKRHTVPWRYAILRMHETIALAVPRLSAEDYQRFNLSFKHIFVDDYATVPHESIERLLALHRAGKLDVLTLGPDYMLDTETPARGARLYHNGKAMHFPAFIEAMGQRPLSAHEFPFQSLWRQGLLENATVPQFFMGSHGERRQRAVDIGGIDIDTTFHPVSNSPYARRIYCLSLPFMLGQFPFAQGITSSSEMGKKTAKDLMRQFSTDSMIGAGDKAA